MRAPRVWSTRTLSIERLIAVCDNGPDTFTRRLGNETALFLLVAKESAVQAGPARPQRRHATRCFRFVAGNLVNGRRVEASVQWARSLRLDECQLRSFDVVGA